eukprot:6483696-Amphidinium_carterae.1
MLPWFSDFLAEYFTEIHHQHTYPRRWLKVPVRLTSKVPHALAGSHSSGHWPSHRPWSASLMDVYLHNFEPTHIRHTLVLWLAETSHHRHARRQEGLRYGLAQYAAPGLRGARIPQWLQLAIASGLGRRTVEFRCHAISTRPVGGLLQRKPTSPDLFLHVVDFVLASRHYSSTLGELLGPGPKN